MIKIIFGFILVLLCAIEFWAFGKYNVVNALYQMGQPFSSVMILVGIASVTGVIGLILLLGGDFE